MMMTDTSHTTYTLLRVRPDPPVITGSTGGVVSTGAVVRVTEGQSLTLTCVCQGGFPAPTLAWYRNSVTHVTPTDSSTTNGSVTITYTYRPNRNDDQDTYICRSSFTDTQPETINQTSVQLYLNLKPSTPTVQQNGAATAGSTATLQCGTYGFRPQDINISWTYNGLAHNGTLQTVAYSGETFRATSTLHLSVERQDNGKSVQCIVTHFTLSNPLAKLSTAMNVHFAPVSATVSGNTQTVADGTTTLTLECTIGDANPAPAVSDFSWTGPGVGGKTSQTVTLTPTRDQDGAALTCTAKNYVGSTTSQNVNLNLTYSPEANIIGWPTTVIEGKPNVDLACTASSKPVAMFTWYKDNTKLGNDTGTLAHNSWTYRINKVNRTDSGQYNCTANNGISPVDVQTMALTVQYPPDVNATGYDGTVNNVSVTIMCSPTGVPNTYTYYSWVHSWSDGQVISHQPVLPATQTLTLTGLMYQLSGVYTCRVSNGIAPYRTPAANISEGSTSFITIKSNPVIIDKVNKVTTQLRQPTNFNITYYSNAGVPNVSVHRVFNNGTVSVSVGNVTTETTVIQLPMLDNSTVPASGIMATVNLTIDDESELGFYQVKLRNEIGTSTLDLQIKPKGPPEPPENPTVSGVSTTSVNVSWNPGFHGGLDQTFVVQYSTDSSTDNKTWTDGPTLNTGLSDSRDLHHVYVDKLSPGQLYYLRIYAYNEMGRAYTDTFSITTSTQEEPASSNVAAIAGAAGGGGLALIIIVIVAVYIFWRRRSRPNGNKNDKYSAHVYENEFGTDRRKPPNVARRVPATPPTQDNCPSDTTSAGTGPGPVYEEVDGYPQDADGSQAGSPAGTASAGTGPGPVYEEVDGHPEVGAGSRDESITATYEMLDRRQSENRSYEELQLPGYPQAADGSQDGRPAGTDSAGIGPGPVYEEVGGHPEVGAGSRDESITAAYEMLDRRQSENRSYEELQLPAPPEYENTRIP